MGLSIDNGPTAAEAGTSPPAADESESRQSSMGYSRTSYPPSSGGSCEAFFRQTAASLSHTEGIFITIDGSSLDPGSPSTAASPLEGDLSNNHYLISVVDQDSTAASTTAPP